jgi:zinc protease
MHGRRSGLALIFAVACGGQPPAPVAARLDRGAPAPRVEPPPTDPMAAVTPLDPQIKVGHLANGLTYYVMKHGKPAHRAALWLAVDAGSVLEDDDQRGLAHFVEHMAFNGTKRFPKQDIVNYIEKIGMDFGADLNAYTSFDQTVYQLTVPTDDPAILHEGIEIIHDWAGDVTFDPAEVDKERGVVLEEWRTGRGAFERINAKQWPVMFAGSRYAERLPIGLPETLKTAKRDTIARFYKDWYRPDNMAVIAVGDFDPAAVEKMITERFGDLTNPNPERPRTRPAVPHDQPTAVTIASDPEFPFTQVSIIDKLDHRPERTKGDFRRFVLENLYNEMMGARFAELELDPASPFMFAGSSTGGGAVRGGDTYVRQAQAKDGKVKEALVALVEESARVEQFGFVQTELDRAKLRALASSDQEMKEWDKVADSELADEITRNFFEQEQMGGRALEHAYTKEVLASVTLADLDHLARSWSSSTTGRVIAIAAGATSQLPSEAEVKQLVDAARTAPLVAWRDVGADKPLIAQLPRPGAITKETFDEALGATVWTLSNGIRVVVKPTTFQNDEILLDGWQKGGTSVLSDTDFGQVRFPGLLTAMGVGDLDPPTLEKVLSGHLVNVSAGYSELAETVSGSSRPADLETMLQLAYLRMTAPRKDLRAFAAWKHDQLEWIQHRKVLPEVRFWEQMGTLRTNNHLRHRPQTEAMLEAVDPDKAIKVFRSRYRDFSSFTFTFVGNIDPVVLRPLVAIYLASLPGTGAPSQWRDIGVRFATGPVTRTILAGTEPKSHVMIDVTASDTWSLAAERDAEILSKVLEIRLREVMREEMGGVYGVSVSASMIREPQGRRDLEISFTCDPQNVDKLEHAALGEIAQLAKDGVAEGYLAKVREQLRREHETNVKDNGWWSQALRAALWSGEDFKAMTDVDAIAARATSANVKASAHRFFDPKKVILGVMRPTRAAAPTR